MLINTAMNTFDTKTKNIKKNTNLQSLTLHSKLAPIFNVELRVSTICNLTNQTMIQWNLDLTKSLGTGQICSLNGGFVILKTSI